MSEIVCIYFIVLPIFLKVSYVLIFAKKFQIRSSFILRICVCSRCRLWQFWVYASAYVRSGQRRNFVLFALCQKSLTCLEGKSMTPNFRRILIFLFLPATPSSHSRTLGRLFEQAWRASSAPNLNFYVASGTREKQECVPHSQAGVQVPRLGQNNLPTL